MIAVTRGIRYATRVVLRTIQRFAANNAWSNLRLLRACSGLSAEAFAAPRTSFFPSLTETMNHILILDWYCLDGLEGGGRGLACFESDNPFPELPALTAEQRAADRRLVAFVDALSAADLETTVTLQRTCRVLVETVGDTLLHLFTHQIHHRGQAHAMLSGTDVKPPPLDEFFMSADLELRAEELEELGLPLA